MYRDQCRGKISQSGIINNDGRDIALAVDHGPHLGLAQALTRHCDLWRYCVSRSRSRAHIARHVEHEIYAADTEPVVTEPLIVWESLPQSRRWREALGSRNLVIGIQHRRYIGVDVSVPEGREIEICEITPILILAAISQVEITYLYVIGLDLLDVVQDEILVVLAIYLERF